MASSAHSARRLARDWGGLAALVFLAVAIGVTLLGPWIVPHDPARVNVPGRLRPPGAAHWFGTDRFGRDAFARAVFGLRVTLGVASVSVAFGLLVGSTLGALSSYFTRAWGWITRSQEVLLSFPPILLAIVIVATLGQSLATLCVALSVVQVPYFAIMTRNLVRGQRSLEYVAASVAVGARDGRILARHIAPNVLPALLVYGTIRLSGAVLSVSYLSFLGLGPSPPTPELGLLISEGRQHLFTHPFLVTYPAALLFPLVLSINLLGDSLRDAMEGHAPAPPEA